MKEWDWHGNSSLAVCFFSVIIITVLVVTCKWSVARIVTYDTYVVYKTRDNVTYLAPSKEFKIRREENYFTESLLELWVVWHCAISPFDCSTNDFPGEFSEYKNRDFFRTRLDVFIFLVINTFTMWHTKTAMSNISEF